MSRRVQRVRGRSSPAGTKYVGRGSRWGNPHRIGAPVEGNVLHGWHWPRDGRWVDGSTVTTFDRHAAVVAYRGWLAQQLREDPLFLEPLRGFLLACYCAVDEQCHADVILEWFEAHPKQPGAGDRPIFGLHRQVQADAATAPAWGGADWVTPIYREARR